MCAILLGFAFLVLTERTEDRKVPVDHITYFSPPSASRTRPSDDVFTKGSP